jgi:hypothetical protein
MKTIYSLAACFALFLSAVASAAVYDLKQSSTSDPLAFIMVDSVDHVTAKTGLSPTVTLSKAGGAFASPAGAVTEIASGWYKVAGNATDTNTTGPLILHATASGADPTDAVFIVRANVLGDTLPANVTQWNSSAIATPDTAGYPKVTVKDGTGTGEIDTASGHIANVDTITTYTGNTPQTGDNFARIGVNGAGLTNLASAANLATVNSTVNTTASTVASTSTTVTAIKAKTDNLPASPAATGDAMTLAADALGASALATSAVNEIASAVQGVTTPISQVPVPLSRTVTFVEGSTGLVGDQKLGIRTGEASKVYAGDFRNDLATNGRLTGVTSLASSDETVVTVDSASEGYDKTQAKFKLTPAGAGTATITVTVTYDDSDGGGTSVGVVTVVVN